MGYHDGIDLMAEGANVLAAADGTVTAVKNLPGLGTVVILTHGNGWESRYGHLQGIRVSPGQEVKAGTVLGTCSAKSCGENSGFHFSIYAKGQPVDPEGIIPGLGRISIDGSRNKLLFMIRPQSCSCFFREALAGSTYRRHILLPKPYKCYRDFPREGGREEDTSKRPGFECVVPSGEQRCARPRVFSQ